MSLLRSFTKDTLHYGIGNAVKKFLSFLLLPLYTRVLTPSDYGILDTLATGVLILSILFGIRLTEGASRYYYEIEDPKEKGVILFTVFIVYLLTLLPSLILGFFSKEISTFLFKTDKYSWVVFLSFLTIPTTLLNDEQSWIYRYKRKPWRFNFYVLVRAVLNIFLGVMLVISLKKGVIGAQLATVISLFVTIVFSVLTFTWKEYTFRFSLFWFKKLVRFSYPLMLSGVIAWIYSSADRYLLLGYKGTSDVGLYSIGITFARPIALLNMAIGMSFYPFFMSLYEKEKDGGKHETKKISNQIWYLYLVISLSICSFLSLWGKELISIVATPAYSTAAIVIPLCLFSQIFRQSIDITSLGMFLKEKTIHYTWLIAVTSGVSLSLNFLLIPNLSYQGAAISNMVSNFVYLIIAYNLSQKFFYVKRNIKQITLYIIIIFLISNTIPIIEVNYGYNFIFIFKLFLMLVCVVLPFVFGLLSIRTVKGLLLSRTVK